MATWITYMDSPLGKLRLESDGSVLTGLWFTEEIEPDTNKNRECEKALSVFDETKHWLELYFEGKVPDFMPPLKAEGTAFQKEVWEILKTIPYGKTMSYGDIAKILAARRGIRRMAAQAVGGAVGKNPISILIPCHRVIGQDGTLVGYGGGLDKKVWLLKREGIIL